MCDQSRNEEWLSLSVCQTADADDCSRIGFGLRKSVEASGRRAVIMASGAFSHTFWPLKELEKHETADPVHIRTPKHRNADETRIEQLLAGNHAAFIRAMTEYHQFKPEARFRHYLIMAAALGGEDCRAPGRKYS